MRPSPSSKNQTTAPFFAWGPGSPRRTLICLMFSPTAAESATVVASIAPSASQPRDFIAELLYQVSQRREVFFLRAGDDIRRQARAGRFLVPLQFQQMI